MLYHLTRVFRYFKNKEYFPLTNFQKIPNLSNARWSTRAILVSCNPPNSFWSHLQNRRWRKYAALYFITGQNFGLLTKDTNTIITINWRKYWKHIKRRRIHYKDIGNKRPDPSVLDIPGSNQCTERSIKLIQELYYMCKNKDKLQLRFILSKKY